MNVGVGFEDGACQISSYLECRPLKTGAPRVLTPVRDRQRTKQRNRGGDRMVELQPATNRVGKRFYRPALVAAPPSAG